MSDQAKHTPGKCEIGAGDHRALMYAGGLGHAFIGVSDSDRWTWGRDTFAECNSVEQVMSHVGNHKNVRVFRRDPNSTRKKKWLDVTPTPAASTKGGV